MLTEVLSSQNYETAQQSLEMIIKVQYFTNMKESLFKIIKTYSIQIGRKVLIIISVLIWTEDG